MHRTISLVMIVTLLSITSIPLLPSAAEGRGYCVSCHSEPAPGLVPIEQGHTGMHDSDILDSEIHSSMEMQHDMGHDMGHGAGHDMAHSDQHNEHASMMHHESTEQNSGDHQGHDHQGHDHQNIDQHNGGQIQKKHLTAAEQECRIQCGCGCNRNVDGFPQVLSPHVTPTTEFEHDEQIVRIEPETFPALQSIDLTTPLPPPKRS
ncbi:MAG: hypothetical protein ABUK11_01955 [Mariprofundaceae bacterium]